MLTVTKAHAYGNDFLLTPVAGAAMQSPALARSLCHRHHGIGADGLVLYEMRGLAAKMRLLNADGSWSELSGNGLRCLAALVARSNHLEAGAAAVLIATDAGEKVLDLLAQDGSRYTFRADMGRPEDIQQIQIPVLGEMITASVLRTGNPQCVVLGPLPDADRFNRLAPALSTHPMFPAGTNVEFAEIETADRIRIVIWERGVGPTTSSGTGAAASAVAAAAHGQTSRTLDVVAPGGTQRVEWMSEGLFLTGWAEIVMEGQWLGRAGGG
jgi:diaminopimelate epimerase